MRVGKVTGLDLNLFDFDLDLTMSIFFLSPDGKKLYARYGGRDAKSPDSRQSLSGLRHTMQSVVAMHRSKNPLFAERGSKETFYVNGGFGRRCMHCHNVKENIHARLKKDGEWSTAWVYRFPPPDNLGLVLDVDKSNVVKTVTPDSPADKAGLKQGDVIRKLNNVPIHSFADATYALDLAPNKGTIAVSWQRGDVTSTSVNDSTRTYTANLSLPKDWRKTDISWRPSVSHLVPDLHLYGPDLTKAERRKLGLSARQLAFTQEDRVHSHSKKAGVRPGDVILGVNGRTVNMNVTQFQFTIRSRYLVGDRITVNVLRDGKRINIPLTLIR